MDYMFELGFLGTRAPFFMDLVTIIVAILPLLMLGAISFAVVKKYKHHSVSQIILYIASLIIFIYFELGVRSGGGFEIFMKGSSVSYNYAFVVLIIHILISTFTIFIWSLTVIRVKHHLKKAIHKKMARLTFIGVLLTSLSGIWVYLLLFVY